MQSCDAKGTGQSGPGIKVDDMEIGNVVFVFAGHNLTSYTGYTSRHAAGAVCE